MLGAFSIVSGFGHPEEKNYETQKSFDYRSVFD